MQLKHTLIAAAVALVVVQPGFAADVGSAGGVTISDTELQTMFKDAHTDPSTVQASVIESNLRAELARRIVIGEAKKAGLDKSPEVQKAMARASENELSRRYLASISEPPAGYPSDAEMHAAYDSNKAQLLVPKRVRLSQIFFAGTDDATVKRAAAIDADLKAHPDNFADAAIKNSDDKASAAQGGNLGLVPVKALTPDVAKAIDALKIGGVSNVVTDKSGLHILRLQERLDESTPSFDEVRGDLARAMRQQKTRENEQAYADKLASQYPATINQGLISKMAAPPSAAQGSTPPVR